MSTFQGGEQTESAEVPLTSTSTVAPNFDYLRPWQPWFDVFRGTTVTINGKSLTVTGMLGMYDLSNDSPRVRLTLLGDAGRMYEFNVKLFDSATGAVSVPTGCTATALKLCFPEDAAHW